MAEATRTKFYEIIDAFLADVGTAAVAADRSLLDVRNGIGGFGGHDDSVAEARFLVDRDGLVDRL